MNGLEAYTTYLAVRNHFKTKSYDYFKYNGKIKVNENSFRTRRDHYQFEKIARIYKRDDFVKYLVANFITEDEYILGMSQGRAMVTHKKWQKSIESFSYQFKEDIQTLKEYDSNFNMLFDCRMDGVLHPMVFKLYLRDRVHINTLVAINQLLDFTKVWDYYSGEDKMIKDFIFLLDKYTPFLYSYINIDKIKSKQIILETFNE